MKTLNKITVLILVGLITSFTNLLNAKTGNDTTSFLINGRLLRAIDNYKINNKCKVLLYHENTSIDSINVKWRKPFEFKLNKNVWYTIKITGEDMVPVMISFNTDIGNIKDVSDVFYFDVEVHSTNTLPFMNKDIIEFPIGHVEFSKKTERLEVREAYARNFQDMIFLGHKEETTLVKD